MSDAAHTPWSIEVTTVGGATCLRLRGELDAATAVELGAHVAAATSPEVQIDLGGVTFMDSSGLAAVLEAHRRLAVQHRRLVVLDRSPAVQRVLDLAGVSAHLDLGQG
ncbi:MAG: STAS domain-containing protein [Acidimicrobiia bacterium]|jgi:anti-anti-sigma factor